MIAACSSGWVHVPVGRTGSQNSGENARPGNHLPAWGANTTTRARSCTPTARLPLLVLGRCLSTRFSLPSRLSSCSTRAARWSMLAGRSARWSVMSRQAGDAQLLTRSLTRTLTCPRTRPLAHLFTHPLATRTPAHCRCEHAHFNIGFNPSAECPVPGRSKSGTGGAALSFARGSLRPYPPLCRTWGCKGPGGLLGCYIQTKCAESTPSHSELCFPCHAYY